jgi:hypothetical protein
MSYLIFVHRCPVLYCIVYAVKPVTRETASGSGENGLVPWFRGSPTSGGLAHSPNTYAP